MKCLPVILKSQMLHAILSGKKTQVRLPMKKQPMSQDGGGWSNIVERRKDHIEMEFFYVCNEPIDGSYSNGWRKKIIETEAPPCMPGEQLWVREAFAIKDGALIYKADQVNNDDRKWIPPLSMHYEVSRIILDVIGVRVERLQSISVGDAIAEGVDGNLGSYRSLWETMYGADSWSKNPWVWVIEFKRADCCAVSA